MTSRILLFVACLSLLTASKAEAQLFRRLLAPQPPYQVRPQFRTQPQFRVQPQYRAQPQVRTQPQQYRQQPTGYYQNGYQGRLTASKPSRPLYVRRSDGSVVAYYRNQPTQTAQAQLQRNAQLDEANRARQAQIQAPPAGSNLVTTQGELTPVQRTTSVQPQLGSSYRPPLQAATTPVGTPVGIPNGASVLSEPPSQASIGSIAPARSMP